MDENRTERRCKIGLILLLSSFLTISFESMAQSNTADEKAMLVSVNAEISNSEFDFSTLRLKSDDRELLMLPGEESSGGGRFSFLKKSLPLQSAQNTTTSTPKKMLGSFFSQKFCAMPKKARKKLTKKRKEGKPYIPKVISASIDNIDQKGILFPSSTLSNVVHRVRISDGTAYKVLPIESAVTYGRIDIQSIRDNEHEGVTYELDCSGFLTTQAKAGILTINASVAGKAEFDKSMLVLTGKIASPIGMAITPAIYNVKLPPFDQYGVLASLATVTLDQNEDVTIEVPAYFFVVAASSQAGEGLQGSFKANANGGFAAISGSVDTSFNSSRNVSYSNFDTLLLPSSPNEDERLIKTTVKSIRGDVRRLFNQAKVRAESNTVSGRTVVAMKIPAELCTLDWQLWKNEGVTLVKGEFGVVEPNYKDAQCDFTLFKTDVGEELALNKSLSIYSEKLDLRYKF